MINHETTKECLKTPPVIDKITDASLQVMLKAFPSPSPVEPFFKPTSNNIKKLVQMIEKNRSCPDQFWNPSELRAAATECFKSGKYINGQKEILKEKNKMNNCLWKGTKKFTKDNYQAKTNKLVVQSFQSNGIFDSIFSMIKDSHSEGVFTFFKSTNPKEKSYRENGDTGDEVYCKISEHVFIESNFIIYGPLPSKITPHSTNINIFSEGFIYVP